MSKNKTDEWMVVNLEKHTSNKIYLTECATAEDCSNSLLKKELQEWDNEYSKSLNIPKVKFVEVGGNKVKDLVCRSNPWKKRHCRRRECQTCDHKNPGQLGKCRSEGILYKIECRKCKGEDKDIKYIGESSRTSYERFKEQIDGAKNNDKRNPLHKHNINEHNGEKQEFMMTVLQTFKKPMNRQVAEKVRIEKESSSSRVMNSKSEWGGAAPT